MVFIYPQPNVYSTLESTQITQIVPVVNDLESVRSYLMNELNDFARSSLRKQVYPDFNFIALLFFQNDK